MSSSTKITMSRGGTDKHVIEAGKISVPDLWHIAETIREGSKPKDPSGSATLILKGWSLCHNLLNHIINQPD